LSSFFRPAGSSGVPVVLASRKGRDVNDGEEVGEEGDRRRRNAVRHKPWHVISLMADVGLCSEVRRERGRDDVGGDMIYRWLGLEGAQSC
jgi:hypothetical protein